MYFSACLICFFSCVWFLVNCEIIRTEVLSTYWVLVMDNLCVIVMNTLLWILLLSFYWFINLKRVSIIILLVLIYVESTYILVIGLIIWPPDHCFTPRKICRKYVESSIKRQINMDYWGIIKNGTLDKSMYPHLVDLGR